MNLPRLNRSVAGGYEELPERVLQFGEGNFLRAFVDWMIDGMNRRGLFRGRVVVVQPIPSGMADVLNEQDGLYTVVSRGLRNGKPVEEHQLVSSVSRAINPYAQFREFLKCASNPDLRFILSNTTEAGIAVSSSDRFTDEPPASFPGKLTRFLHERFEAFKEDRTKGLIVLPCELIDRNGDRLLEAVLRTAELWKLPPAFLQWLRDANVFANTLVDRIVTGFPKAEAGGLHERLGYVDNLLDTAELFHFWAIEAPAEVRRELPLAEAGFDVVWTDNLRPYRDRKVYILNGAHTSMAMTAFLAGKNTVLECMEDESIKGFLDAAIRDEIIPTLELPAEDLRSFGDAVIERFSNPFLAHALLSIALNSVSKYRTRVLPTLERYLAIRGALPPRLTFALAGLIAFYRGTEIVDGALIGNREGRDYRILDDSAVLERFAVLWRECDGSVAALRNLTEAVLAQKEWWGRDLRAIPDLADDVARDVHRILTMGAVGAAPVHARG